jgi:hypothetical protein
MEFRVMRVALDTSIFHKNRSLAGGSFEALARFAEAGHVEVLIPEVIAKEFTALSSEQLDAVASHRRPADHPARPAGVGAAGSFWRS